MSLFKTIPRLRVIFNDLNFFRTVSFLSNNKISNFSVYYSKRKFSNNSGLCKPLIVPVSLLAFSFFSSNSSDDDSGAITFLFTFFIYYILINFLNSFVDKLPALFRAIQQRDSREVDRLLRAQPELANKRHPLGWTPLHAAVIARNMDAVRSLLRAGAKIDTPDLFTTPRDIAQQRQLDERQGLSFY